MMQHTADPRTPSKAVVEWWERSNWRSWQMQWREAAYRLNMMQHFWTTSWPHARGWGVCLNIKQVANEPTRVQSGRNDFMTILSLETENV
jgi:hypothetical protein